MNLHPLLDLLANAFFPQECHVCGALVESLALGVACRRCWCETSLFDGREALCPRCGRYLRRDGPKAVGLCHRCDDHEYDDAVACGIYEGALAFSVLRLKSEPHIPRELETRLCERACRAGLGSADLIVPVPLSERRRKERGFNQAEVIGQCLSRRFGIRMEAGLLSRIKDTPLHRAAMDRKARSATVRKAFEADSRLALDGLHVVLVDDVMTSGATASACAKELKMNGARRISVMTLARA